MSKFTQQDPKARVAECRPNPLCSHALDYGRRGWRIHPLAPHSKEAVVKAWQLAATTVESKLLDWWVGGKGSFNVGLATGPDSGVWVLDVDGPQGEESLAFWEQAHGPLPDTLVARTGKGRHLFFTWPTEGEVRNNAGKLGAGLDVRGEGGYVVLPPSRHPDGPTYTWENDLPVADAPAWLLELLNPPPPEPSTGVGAVDLEVADDDPRVRAAAKNLLGQASRLTEGERNDGTFKVACKLRRVARTEEQWGVFRLKLMEALPIGPSANGGPPFTEVEAAKAIDSAEQHEAIGAMEFDGPPVATVEQQPVELQDDEQPDATGMRMFARPASDIEVVPVEWLWANHVPLGHLTLLAGKPKSGKSTLSMDIAARVSTGAPMPDGTATGAKGAVLVVAPEDSPSEAVARYVASGGDRDQMYVVFDAHKDHPEVEVPPTFPDRVDALERTIRRHGAALVVIDNLTRVAARKLKLTDAKDATEVLAPLQSLAVRTGAAIIAIEHLTKSGAEDPYDAIQGNAKVLGVARAALVVVRDPEDPSVRLLGARGNYSEDSDETLAYRTEKNPDTPGSYITWLGHGAVNLSDAMAASRDDNGRSPELTEAKDFLLEILAGGPVHSATVKERAKDREISVNGALARARLALGIVVDTEVATTGRLTTWALPDRVGGSSQGGRRPPMVRDDAMMRRPPLNSPNADSQGGSSHHRRPIGDATIPPPSPTVGTVYGVGMSDSQEGGMDKDGRPKTVEDWQAQYTKPGPRYLVPDASQIGVRRDSDPKYMEPISADAE